jgi:hypothetical protein
MILLFRSYDYFSSFISVHLVLSARNADESRNQCRRDGSKASSSSCAGQQQVLGRLPWEPSQVAKRTKYCASFRRGLMYMCLFLAHSRHTYPPLLSPLFHLLFAGSTKPHYKFLLKDEENLQIRLLSRTLGRLSSGDAGALLYVITEFFHLLLPN